MNNEREMLQKWYEVDRMSTRKIAKILGINHNVVYKRLKRCGIKIREKMDVGVRAVMVAEHISTPAMYRVWAKRYGITPMPGAGMGESVAQCIQSLGVSYTTVRRLIRKYDIPHVAVGVAKAGAKIKNSAHSKKCIGGMPKFGSPVRNRHK